MESEVLKRWEDLLGKVTRREDLSREEARELYFHALKGGVDEILELCLLIAMNTKGVTFEELSGLADALKDSCAYDFHVELDEPLVNVGGCGGDTVQTINVSTATFLASAGAGAVVGKTGGRGVKSNAGVVDTLECLGVNIHASPEISAHCLKKIGLAFASGLDAYPWLERYYGWARRKDFPVLLKCALPTWRKAVMPAVLNPLKATRFLRGITIPETELICKIMRASGGYERAMVVFGKGPGEGDILDEISNVGQTFVTELNREEIFSYVLEPKDFGLPMATVEEIRGGHTPQEQAKYLMDILTGKDKTPRRDMVLMNTSALLYLADKAKDFKQGMEKALESIEKGKALEKLRLLVLWSGGDEERLKEYLE